MNQLFRRAAPGVAIAGVALTSVWMFDAALHPDAAADVAAAPTQTPSSSPDATDDGTTATPDGSSDGSGGSTGVTDGGTTQDSTSGDCSTTTTTETGDQAMTRWGPVQVQMTFAADGTVCSVEAIAYPDNDPHSARISQQAVPTLDARATAVGVSFDSVSGATYTSEAYRESMQSILDRL